MLSNHGRKWTCLSSVHKAASPNDNQVIFHPEPTSLAKRWEALTGQLGSYGHLGPYEGGCCTMVDSPFNGPHRMVKKLLVEGDGIACCLSTWQAPFSSLFIETIQLALSRSGVEMTSLHPVPLLPDSTQSQPTHLSPNHGGTGLEREPILSPCSFLLKASGFIF